MLSSRMLKNDFACAQRRRPSPADMAALWDLAQQLTQKNAELQEQ